MRQSIICNQKYVPPQSILYVQNVSLVAQLAHLNNITRDHSLHLMLITLILKNCGFCAGQRFCNYFCHTTHLDGQYNSGGKIRIDVHNDNILSKYSGIYWLSCGFNEFGNSLLFTEMKIEEKISFHNVINSSV